MGGGVSTATCWDTRTPSAPPRVGPNPWIVQQNLRRPSRVPVGVGCYFQICHGGRIKVREIASDSPASECEKIRVGDELVRVDSIDIQGKSLSQLSSHVLGQQGSWVKLEFVSVRDHQHYTVVLMREKRSVQSAGSFEEEWEMSLNALRV
ncbi:hypothetical protein GUITHDRAFT_111953 [Guillardia theta CCMP2712]|uniref:PDZ domain-containing protein n=1 Tax=Guillardia theta (strain CCMP2712) TaxID=905079 RepID=L1J1X9_GUITC|nr:hypothetical protein GUITHDRAFT_111953 [Guillardia theta CCMP2712]EKX42100.1 hypothetical protein GUITHDRAFT_111953 [Guillardia theta CCMP2712]|eukprot:XP_005829080.1 hypothetical protein GUITHDRAFT_111953 [Guillardia theta CCMP2712]